MSDSAMPADSGLTALSMLERVRADDADAWRRLVQLYSPRSIPGAFAPRFLTTMPPI